MASHPKKANPDGPGRGRPSKLDFQAVLHTALRIEYKRRTSQPTQSELEIKRLAEWSDCSISAAYRAVARVRPYAKNIVRKPDWAAVMAGHPDRKVTVVGPVIFDDENDGEEPYDRSPFLQFYVWEENEDLNGS